jgi:hypothetical protein
MRAFKAGFAALALGAALAVTGCSQQGSGARGVLDIDAKSVEGFVTKLAGEPFKGKATTQADLAAVQAALPKEVSLTWGGITFDSAANATVLSDVKLTPKDMPQVGVAIQELRLFDFDAEFAKARLTGQRLTETASLASRIDAKGVSMFGMAAMMNGMTKGGDLSPVSVDPNLAQPADPSDDIGPTEPAFDFDDSAPVFEKYDFTFSRVILNDVVLRSIEAIPAPAANAAAAPDQLGMTPEQDAMFRGYINIMRAFGVDTFAAYDMKADFAMKQMGQTIGVSFVAKSMGTRGWRGGDFDASYARDMAYSFNMTEGQMTPAMNASYSIGYVGMEDLHFDKLYGYMAKGVVPPRTETKLMSFGKYTFENQKLNIGGKDIMTVGASDLDARDFHWFIPTKISTSAKNVTLDMAAIIELGEAATAMAGPADPDYPAPPAPDFAAIRAALAKNGLDKPNLNFNFGYTWNETSGDTKVDLGFGGDKLLQVTNKYEGAFPSFKAVSDLIPDDPTQANEAAIAKVFDDSSKLKLVDVNIVDNGGLDKLFNLTADLGPIMAASDPSGGNPMEGQTGASLRQMAGSMLGMVGASPDIAPFVTPISNFVMQGGKLHLLLQPATPMTWTAIGNSLSGTTGSPGEELKKLGLKVEHAK